MEPPERQDQPGGASAPASPPSRGLTRAELEAVIRRAVELEAGDAEGTEGIPDAEVLRIGRELGLGAESVRRALVEVRGRPAEDRGLMAVAMGPGTVAAARTIPGGAAAIRERLDRYITETELMRVQRRFPDRTSYVRDTSLGAELTRLTRGLSRSVRPVGLRQVDVTVAALDDERCHVEVRSELKGARAGYAAGAAGVGGAAGSGVAIAAWATPIADPVMLLAVPVVAGAWLGMRGLYRVSLRSVGEKLETLLDRIEHGSG